MPNLPIDPVNKKCKDAYPGTLERTGAFPKETYQFASEWPDLKSPPARVVGEVSHHAAHLDFSFRCLHLFMPALLRSSCAFTELSGHSQPGRLFQRAIIV